MTGDVIAVLLAMQQAVAEALDEATTLPGAMRRILPAIGNSLNWEAGVAWSLDETAAVLRCETVWMAPTVSAAEFEHLSRQTVLPWGSGLPGRVWAEGGPVWISDVARCPDFPRRQAAARAGLHGALAFPLQSQGKAIGVMEFFSRHTEVPDPTLLAMMAAVGTQIGRFVKMVAMQEDLRYEVGKNNAILAAALDCIVSMDHQGRVTEFNQAAERTFGHEREEVIGRDLADVIIPPHYRAAHRRGLAHYLATGVGPMLGRRVEISGLRKDGTEFPVELAITRIGVDGPPLFTAYLRDITRRKQAEDGLRFRASVNALLASSLDYDILLRTVAQLLVPHLADWCVVAVLGEDRGARRIAGAHADPAKAARLEELCQHYLTTPGDAIGSAAVCETGEPHVVSGISDDDLRDRAQEAVLRDLGLRSYICLPLRIRQRLLGTLLLVSATSSHRYGPEDLAIVEDVARDCATAIDNARLYHEAQEAVQVRDEFLSIASHELKTPLTPLQLQLERLVRQVVPGEPPLPDWAVVKVQKGLQHLDRLTKLIDELLSVSRITSGHLSLETEEVDLVALVHAVIDRHRDELQRAACRVTLQAPTPVVGCWDALRLDEVITNLLTNAFKFGAGRPIEITVGRSGDTATLAVRDQGIGIAPEDQARLFTRFERVVSAREYGGFGLGLWISRQIVEAMGGTIAVDSAPGQGAVFSVTLPL